MVCRVCGWYGGLIMVANNPLHGDYAVSAMYDDVSITEYLYGDVNNR